MGHDRADCDELGLTRELTNRIAVVNSRPAQCLEQPFPAFASENSDPICPVSRKQRAGTLFLEPRAARSRSAGLFCPLAIHTCISKSVGSGGGGTVNGVADHAALVAEPGGPELCSASDLDLVRADRSDGQVPAA